LNAALGVWEIFTKAIVKNIDSPETLENWNQGVAHCD
jgi:hypothetical protein